MRTLLHALFLLSLLSLGSCAAGSSFRVRVDGVADDSARGLRTYVMQPMESYDELTWREYSATLERALEAEGWMRVEEGSPCELVVALGYGITGPYEQQYTYVDPVYGQTGSTTTYQSNAIYGDPYSSTATTTPTYGITDYVTRVGTRIQYDRNLQVSAHLVDRGGEVNQTPAWRVIADSSGSSGDLRRVFPVLVAAAQPHLGKSTGQRLEVSLDEDDPRIAALQP